VAERRDLMVATYSLDCATGASVTATVCTGMACIPTALDAAGFLSQPTIASIKITIQPVVKMRFKLLSSLDLEIPWKTLSLL
jgi:hypothetical protein